LGRFGAKGDSVAPCWRAKARKTRSTGRSGARKYSAVMQALNYAVATQTQLVSRHQPEGNPNSYYKGQNTVH